MQCLGLTNERRRCRAEAVAGTGYCAQHRQEMAHTSDLASAESSAGRGVANIFNKLRGVPSRRVIPDPARFDVPPSLKNKTTAEVIQELLHHPDAMVRWSAAFTLRKRQDPVAIEPLWEVLHHDRSRPVRQQAAVALGKIGVAAVLGPLIEGLVHDPDAGVRQACAIALGNVAHPRAARDLAHALAHESSFFVRWDCILALGQVGDPAAAPVLARLAEEEPSEYLRRAYRNALAEIRQRSNGRA